MDESRPPPRSCLAQTDVVVLAGGLGTRIRSVLKATPKILAPVGDRTFFSFLMSWLESFGARRVILSLGHGADAIIQHLAHHRYPALDIFPLVEPSQQGTAGAIRFVHAHLKTDPVVVVNGDSFIDADLCTLLAEHRRGGKNATLLCCRMDDTGRFGRIARATDGTVAAFDEKSENGGPGLINAGIYAFSRAGLDALCAQDGPSLERDYFAKCPPGTLNTHVSDGAFIDIGTPESLASAEHVLARFFPK